MKRSNITLIILSVIVFLTLVYGYIDGGSPKSAQNKRTDSTRVRDVLTIRSWVNSYFQANKTLPATILEASKKNMDTTIPTDPETKNDYEYMVTSPLEFNICATFKESNVKTPGGMDQELAHPSGYYCYSYTAGKY